MSKFIASRNFTHQQLLQVVKSRNIQLTAEAWAASMFLEAKKKDLSTDKIFVRKGENPPDFLGVVIHPKDNYWVGEQIDIEVTRYLDESPLSVMQEIEKKVKKAYFYSRNTVVVCHITKSNFKMPLQEIIEGVLSMNPKNEVWVIGSDGNHGQVVTQVYPFVKQFSVDILDMLNRPFSSEDPAFLQEDMNLSPRVKEGQSPFKKTGKTQELSYEFKISEIKYSDSS